MGCRCSDISMYESDIGTLESAIEEADKLIGHADSVNEGIANLGTLYPSTLNTSEGFYSALSKLDEDAQEKAASIKTKLETQKSKVEGWLKSAREEDAAYDHTGHSTV